MGSVTATNWAARLSVGLIGTALILGLAPSTTSSADGTVSTYSEAYRLQRYFDPPAESTFTRVVLSLPAPRPATTTTIPDPVSRESIPDLSDPVTQQYRYFERSQNVTALQIELGMRYVDGIYGPETRKAHIGALGGPTAVLYRNYPEIGQTPTPCSHGCEPGDGHYELPTLGALINEYFLPEDRALAQKIAFCESSARSWDIGSTEVSSALAVGWFQHLAKYWVERSEKAGFKDYDPFNGRANVAVAAWLYYSSGVHHWNPSKACWGEL